MEMFLGWKEGFGRFTKSLSPRLIKEKIPAYLRLTFFAAILLGLITHLYMLTNKLPNHDDITMLDAVGPTVTSGRWMLGIILSLNGNLSLPWLNGLLAIMWLALACCCTVELLKIRKPMFCVITAAIMVTFPVVTSTLTYMFTADAYFLALFLACLSVLCAVRFRFGWIFAVPLLALSMGIYQSYFAVAAVLSVGTLILDTLQAERSFRQLLGRSIRLLLVLLAGMLLYMGIVRITTLFVELSSYMGINEMGSISLSQIPDLVLEAYQSYIRFFIRSGGTVMPRILRGAMLLCIAASLGLVGWSAWKQRMPAAKIVLLGLLVLVYPLAGNIVRLMTPTQTPHMLMLYGLCYLPVFLIMILEHFCRYMPEGSLTRFACVSLFAVTLVATSFRYAVTANQVYLKLDVAGKQLASYSTRLLSAIQSTPGYSLDKPIVFVKWPGSSAGAEAVPAFDELKQLGALSLKDYLNAFSYPQYLKKYHGFNGKIYPGGAAWMAESSLLKVPELETMPSYPSDGSIRIIDGHVYVKFRW